MSAAAELVARCFAARTAAHFAHFKTGSYAAHVALEAFYTDLLPATDEFAECYAGVFGKFTSFPTCELCSGEVMPVKELRDWVVKNREKAAQGNRELENLIDNITAVCDRAVYKLVNLK